MKILKVREIGLSRKFFFKIVPKKGNPESYFLLFLLIISINSIIAPKNFSVFM